MSMSDVLDVKHNGHVHHIPEAWLVGATRKRRNEPTWNISYAIEYWCLQEFIYTADELQFDVG